MMSSNKAVSWKRFPIGELSQKRKRLKEDYLEVDAKCVTLQNELRCVKKDMDNFKKYYNLLERQYGLQTEVERWWIT